MGKRQDSMAAIDAVLTGANSGGNTEQQTRGGNTSDLAPHITPHIAPPPPHIVTEKSQQKEQEGTAARTKTPLTAEEQAQADAKARAASFNETASNIGAVQGTVNTAKGVLSTGAAALEDIPTPGSIMFPLVMLLVFFLLLLPVNGHTRFTWLWLAITGNATIGPDTGSDASVSPTADLTTSTNAIATSAAQIDATASLIAVGIIHYMPGGD